jgi:EAL domain-containing protein (putative c-di-GMP-specific phosphodiesterase class I)
VFDDVMRARAFARLRVENDLRRALDRHELALVYQPVVSLHDQSLVGVEALVRWHHPDRGLVPPSDFIEIAEENGLIEPIGRWVLEEACRQAGRWHQAHPDHAPIGVSVNLSAVQVAQKTLADTVSEVLETTGIDPSVLSLEITESAILTEMETVGAALAPLKALGVRLVLDDFGTGYSSLGYLTHLPLDTLKIDRSFIDGLGIDPRDTAITEAIIAMSHALSLDVVAEGVETAVQTRELERLGCQLAQGFRFSVPVPAIDITRILDRGGVCGAGASARARADQG